MVMWIEIEKRYVWALYTCLSWFVDDEGASGAYVARYYKTSLFACLLYELISWQNKMPRFNEIFLVMIGDELTKKKIHGNI